MSSSDAKSKLTNDPGLFNKVGENLYRLTAPGGYYALLKRGDKQFRRSLKTKDRKLAERRLAELRQLIGNLSTAADTSHTGIFRNHLDGP